MLTPASPCAVTLSLCLYYPVVDGCSTVPRTQCVKNAILLLYCAVSVLMWEWCYSRVQPMRDGMHECLPAHLPVCPAPCPSPWSSPCLPAIRSPVLGDREGPMEKGRGENEDGWEEGWRRERKTQTLQSPLSSLPPLFFWVSSRHECLCIFWPFFIHNWFVSDNEGIKTKIKYYAVWCDLVWRIEGWESRVASLHGKVGGVEGVCHPSGDFVSSVMVSCLLGPAPWRKCAGRDRSSQRTPQQNKLDQLNCRGSWSTNPESSPSNNIPMIQSHETELH